MSVSPPIELSRDVEATAIPSGRRETLGKGVTAYISQELGGAFTVHAQGALYRIEGRDADALGREALVEEPVDEEVDVWGALRNCYDPEIPVNIVDLGLVYDMEKRALPNGRYRVLVRMTLTAPGCGMGEVIAGDAREKLVALPAVEDATVELVWDPPWHQSMISAEGRKKLGLE